MGEGGGCSDTDSDETIVEGSVGDSDPEEEEVPGERRLSLIDKDMAPKTESNHATGTKIINGEMLSPEIHCIHISRQTEPINLGLDDEYSPEMSLLSGIHAVVELPKDSATKCTEISDSFQRVRIITNKEDATESGLSPEAAASGITKSRIMIEKFEVQDLLEPLCDSENSQISPLLHMLEYQDNTLCVIESLDKSSALPEELLIAINSFSESILPPCQPVGKEGGQSMTEQQPTPESVDDDCTQITDTNFESQFHAQHLKETEHLRLTLSPFPSEKQLDCDKNLQKLVILDHQPDPSYNRAAGKENSSLEGSSSCKQATQATSYALRKSARRKRELPCSDVDAASKRFLEQKIQKNQAQARSTEYDDGAQESNIKGQADQHSWLETDIVSDMNTKVKQVRKNQRTARRNGKQITSKTYSSDSSFRYISPSNFNRRDIFGQTLLHRAAMEDNLNHVRAVIKAGANVNAQDYAGWTPLHEASVAGYFEITKELLKAGANVNCRGSEQITPLHEAVSEGHYKVAELLLLYGANPLLKEEKGKSAIEEATDNRMRTLLESYAAKSNRRLRSAKSLVEDPVIEQSKIDKSQSQPKVKPNLSDRVQLSFNDNTKVLRQHSVKQNKGKRNPQQNSVTTIESNSRLLKETTFKSPCLVSKAKQSSTEMPPSSLGTSGSKMRKSNQREVTQNDLVHTTTLHFSKRILQPFDLLHKLDSISEAREQLSVLRETQQESDSSNNNNYCSSEGEKAHQSTQLSGTTKGQLTNSNIVTSPIPIQEESILPSVTHLVNESSVASTHFLNKDIGLSPMEEEQCIQKQQSNVPSSLQVDSLGDNLQTVEKMALVCKGREEGINPENEQNREQYLHSEIPIYQVLLDCHTDVILEHELNLKDTLYVTESISLEENLLESKNTTTQLLQETAHFNDSVCTVLSEHNFITDQNTDKNSSKAVGICNEQTVQVSMEMSSTCTFSQGINRTDVSESLDTYSSSPLRNFTPRIHEDLMVGPRAKEILENVALKEQKMAADDTLHIEMIGKCSSELNGKANLNNILDVPLDEFKTAQSKRMQNNFNENCQDARFCSSSNAKNVSSDTHQKQQIPEALDSSHFSKKEKTTSSQQLPSVAARIYKRNSKGETCLHMAAKKGDLSLVKSLIASGACVNQKDNAGWTPIHEASHRGYTEVIAELLKAGADVNCKGLDGVLPIHDAVASNHFETVQFLLDHGANIETDSCGKNVLDEATCDKMVELLKSYGATETKKTSRMSDIAGREIHLPKSRRICSCYDCCGKNQLVSHSNAAKQKCGTHESLSKILQDIKKKQGRLLLLELKNQRDADLYIQDLSQIQNLLNGVLAKQKSERDDLAKKYRASAESFKLGTLREQLIKLVSRQKSLLLMAQKQKELGQKILNYNNAKKEPSCSAKQKFELHNLVPENRLGVDTSAEELNSRTLDSTDQATLLSEPDVCFIQTAQTEKIDYISVASQGNKHPSAQPRTSIRNISASGNIGIAVSQPTTEDQHECLQQHSNINKELTNSYLATHQKDSFLNNRIALDDNLEPLGMFSHALSLNRFSQNPSQSSDNHDSEKKLNFKTKRRKIPRLLDLLELGKIKPGDDVLEFTLQDSKHKASLLGNGKIKTPSNSVYINPVQWIKALLGLSVSWKHVWNKVTYCGIPLSTLTAEVEEFSELPLQQKRIFGRNSAEQGHGCVAECFSSHQKATSLQDVCNIQQEEVVPSCQEEVGILSSEVKAEEPSSVVSEITKYSTFQGSIVSGKKESSYQANSSKTLKRLLQLSESVLIKDEEFMPCHIMDQYWNFYVHCENFGFETTF